MTRPNRFRSRSLAASAAALGGAALAAAPNADAAIIWSGDLDLTLNYASSPGDTYNFVMPGDVTPFLQAIDLGKAERQLRLQDTPSVALLSSSGIPLRLPSGTEVSASSVFNSDVSNSLLYIGNWIVGDRGFLGFRVQDGTDFYYAWADISIPDGLSAVLHSWAYESSPNVGIFTGAVPEPSTGGLMLTAGLAAAVLARRFRRPNRAGA